MNLLPNTAIVIDAMVIVQEQITFKEQINIVQIWLNVLYMLLKKG